MQRVKYTIKGIVQGVGFRPFVYKQAIKNKLTGYVLNNSNGVIIEIEGKIENLEVFDNQLRTSPPPLSNITKIEKEKISIQNDDKFTIIQSKETNTKTTLISPDMAICSDCKKDLKYNTHYKNYFATNCTNCGPRYSIIKTVPYDRANTSMDKFTMCVKCEDEYTNPLSRRYHAQPIACDKCGPQLTLIDNTRNTNIKCNNPIEEIASKIKSGHLVAIKGIGGFHIICDSTNDSTIKKLRQYKKRPTKPFALMCKDIEQIKSFSNINAKEEELLLSKEAPIVILDTNNKFNLSHQIAPNINKIGSMLPYSPLHILLFEHLINPIIATSANLGDEPIITTSKTIKEKLPFIEFILDFDRDIINAIDDSLVQVVDNQIQILRLARGYAPKVINLNNKIDNKILSVGANQKSTISLAYEDKIILSPHIGDLGSNKSFDYFTRTIETFKRFYDFKPDAFISDKHQGYASSKWAKQQNITLKQVQHHLAHIYSVKAEHNLSGDYLGFSFDGTGLGDDETLWGGEIFVGDERKYHFKSIKLLGGEKAIKEPRRVALSLLFDRYRLEETQNLELECVKSFSKIELTMLYQAYIKNLNAPLSSSVGRLFDAVASLSSLCQYQSYEGEAGLLCESVYDKNIKENYTYCISNGEITIDFDYFDTKIVSKFINTLVKIIIDIAKIEKKDVILSGGVFQNKTLLNLVIKNLKAEKINYYYNQTTPCNDGGISLGQLYYGITKYTT
jgi:hydrogenase maturation protein HypF